MQPGPGPWRRLVAANPENAAIRLDPRPGAPAGNKRARERGIEEIDRDGVIQHPADPDGVIAHPSAPQARRSSRHGVGQNHQAARRS
jgi:hypothetical protein